MLKFEATIRHQGKIIQTGKISSVKLIPYIGKKVKVTIREVKTNA